MEDWEARIEIDEENLGGKPVIKGTGVAVHVIVGTLASTASFEEVRNAFGLSDEDVRAALAYATDTVISEVIHSKSIDRISVDPRIIGGKPAIAGTRVPVRIVVGALAGGNSIDEVCEGWRISREDVLAAVAYAAHSVAQEVVHALPAR
jgi:uncharacterized protein (DUF433 family)